MHTGYKWYVFSVLLVPFILAADQAIPQLSEPVSTEPHLNDSGAIPLGSQTNSLTDDRQTHEKFTYVNIKLSGGGETQKLHCKPCLIDEISDGMMMIRIPDLTTNEAIPAAVTACNQNVDISEQIACEISAGDVDMAVESYKANNLKGKQVQNILNKCYTAARIENLLIFVHATSLNIEEEEDGLAMILKLIEDNHDLDKPEILVGEAAIKKMISVLKNPSDPKVTDYLSRLDAAIDKILVAWGKKIIAGDLDYISSFIDSKGKVLAPNLERLTQTVWNNSVVAGCVTAEFAAGKILDLAEILRNDHGQTIWTKLFDIMDQSENQFVLTAGMRIALNEYEQYNENTTLARRFPTHWRPIVTGQPVCLTNIETESTVFVRDVADSLRDRVFASNWKGDPNPISDEPIYDEEKGTYIWSKILSKKWKMKTNDRATSWLIESDPTGDYLYAAFHERLAVSDQKRGVYTWKQSNPGSDCFWRLSDVQSNWKQNRFYLQNTQYQNEYLGVDNDEELKSISKTCAFNTGIRNVFTWRKAGKAPNSEWKIVPYPCK